jgi:hypothetical protein
MTVAGPLPSYELGMHEQNGTRPALPFGISRVTQRRRMEGRRDNSNQADITSCVPRCGAIRVPESHSAGLI